MDLSGSALGYLRKERVVSGAEIQVGDVIIGLKSSGMHSNGMTLARKILESNEVDLDDKFDRLGKTIGMELLTPTHIYVRDVLNVLDKIKVSGMVDVTGGGLKNFVRLKKNVQFAITDPMEPQPIFEILGEMGAVEPLEMYKTFNMGMGYAIILPEENVGMALSLLGEKAKVVGEVVEGTGCSLSPLSLHYESY